MPSLSSPPISKSQFTVTSTAFPGTYFSKFSGLDDKSETSSYADGLDFRKYYLIGLSQLEPMTLEIQYSPLLHTNLILYKKQNACNRFLVAVTPVDCSQRVFRASAKSTLYLTGCQMTGVKTHEVDRKSAEEATVMLSFVADDYYLG